MVVMGIDCGQLQHRYCVVDEAGRVVAEGGFEEKRSSLQELRQRMEGYGRVRVVMEASGSYWQNLRAECAEWGWEALAVNPQRAAQFARLESPRHKTDKADARALARLGLGDVQGSFGSGPAVTLAHALAGAIEERARVQNRLHSLLVVANPAIVWCRWKLNAPRTLAVLKAYPTSLQLCRARGLARVRFGTRGVVGRRAAETLQEASREALCGAVNEAHGAQVGFLVEQISRWSGEIVRLERELERRLPEAERLCSVLGVGKRTALIVYACVPFAQLRSAKQAAAFAGLHPHLFQSGQHSYARLSKRGDAVVRTALYRAALPAVVHNPRLAEFYQRLRDRDKTPKQALCAVAHKLIRICFALVKTQTTFSLTYAPDLP